MTDKSATLLIEVGCEELPPQALDQLTDAFFNGVCDGLEAAALAFDRGGSRALQTPRRMSLLLASVNSRQADRTIERKGPAVQAAFDENGEPTRAATGFASSVGRTVDSLERMKTDKGEWLFCRIEEPGKALDELLFPILQSALDALPVPRPMRWSDHTFSFVRPVHWLVVLHGDRVIPGSLYGQTSDRVSHGHRIHAPAPIELEQADDYIDALETAYVTVDHHARRERIRQQAEALSEAASAGGSTRITDALLAEVNNLVEWPVAVCCQFEEAFLDVPAEALIASMEQHQKFFPILDRHGQLTNRFVVMANIESTDVEAMSRGYERVIRPRLADAQFFWQQDLQQPLESWLTALDKVVFQKDLGTVGDKSRRISVISKQIAEFFGSEPEAAARGGRLCKADLVSQMVGEFPELQGTMGGYYLARAGESEAVATAVAEHYLPRYAGDALPSTDAGRAVALADRLDTLVGIFAVGLKPTGNKDPFALRRAALGVIRLLESAPRDVSLQALINIAGKAHDEQRAISSDTIAAVHQFLIERLRNHLLDAGHSSRQVSATLAAPMAGLQDLAARITAVGDFMKSETAEALVAANKRIGNMLKKSADDISKEINADRFTFAEESSLFAAYQSTKNAVTPLFESGDYSRALAELAALRAPVDAYFETVMVMDDDPEIRGNRLAQLAAVKQLFDQVADFSLAD